MFKVVQKHAASIIAVLVGIGGVSWLFSLPAWAILSIGAVSLFVVGVLVWMELRHGKQDALKPVSSFTLKHYDRYVFVYGSLLIEDNLLRTIGRPARENAKIECLPCVLKEYTVDDWIVSKKESYPLTKRGRTYTDISYLGALAARPKKEGRVEGAIIGVSEADYLALKNRELSYHSEDVTHLIEPARHRPDVMIPDDIVVTTFVPDEDALDPPVPGHAFVRKGYFMGVSRALESLGFKSLQKPDGFRFVDLRLTNEVIENRFRSRRGKQLLKEINDTLSRQITEKRIYAVRPVCLPGPLCDDIRRVAELTVEMAALGLRVLDTHSEILRFAGYKEAQDAELLRTSIERDELIPGIARVDMILSGNRLLVLELNADSPAGMRHCDLVSKGQCEVLEAESSMNWLDCRPTHLVDAVLEQLTASTSGKDQPHHAVLAEYDLPEWPFTIQEMNHFVDQLRKKPGIEEASLVDLAKRKLIVRNEGVFLEGVDIPIDVIYKRALWEHLKQCPDNGPALAECYVNGKVKVVNSLGSRFAGNKLILAMLKSEQFPVWATELGRPLSDEQKKVIKKNLPETGIWGDVPEELGWSRKGDVKEVVRSNPRNYVVKSFHGYGGHDVTVGLNEISSRTWEKLERRYDQGYVFQEFIPHGRTHIALPTQDGDVVWRHQYFILGAYVVNGKCIGIEAKSDDSLPINMAQDSYRTAVFSTKYR